MKTDPDDAPEEGERLILVTDAREAGSTAFHAALKHRSILVSELLVAGLFLTFGVSGSLAPAIVGLAAIALLEWLRRRARSEAERTEALADELAAVVDASDRLPGHPTI